MYGVNLTGQEIRQRLQQGRNYERLYRELKPRYDAALKRIASLEAENTALREQFAAITEAQAARIEQLEAMVFGRKPPGTPQTRLRLRPERPARTYRRPLPKAGEITANVHIPVAGCKHCGGTLTDIREYVRYEEDIELAALNAALHPKTVTRQTIERGWCVHCGKYTSAANLSGQAVTIGPHVRLLVVYLVTIQGLTYGQVIRQLQDLYRFSLTDGEVEVILAAQRQALLPAYEQLKDNIRAGPAHLDETRYPIQSEQGDGYAWVMAGADGSTAEHDVVFELADSRGAGHADGLLGKHCDQVGITDRYAGYKHRFVKGHHQVCWAHLARNARDITRLQCLDAARRKHVHEFYQGLQDMYALVRQYRREPFDQAQRTQRAAALLPGIVSLCQPHEPDPKQLKDLKHGILDYADCLFVCLTEPNVPPDNNKAERLIRQLVMERRRSFGVQTKKGARVMSVLESVAWSLWYKDREQFFPNLQALVQAG